MMSSSALTHVSHVYNRREEDFEQEGREHAPLMNNRYNILWHAKTGEYCLEEGLINGVVRSFKVNKVKHTYDGIRFFHANSCSAADKLRT